MEFLLIIFAIIIIYVVYSKLEREKRIKQCFTNFSNLNSFTPHESYVSADIKTSLAIDKKRRLICIQDEMGQCHFYNERNIINSQIVLNEHTYQKHKFINTWWRYLIGKSIGGSVVGGVAALTGKVRIDKEVNSIKLKIIVNDLTKPNYTITFLDGSTSISKQENALKQAEYWDGLIKVFIHDQMK